MKLLADWLPILVFFAVYKAVDLLTATAAAIAASLAMVALLRLRGMAIEKMQWISLGLIVLMGGATLLLNDETFIKHKPTALYVALSAGLVLPLLWGARPPLQSLMGRQMSLPEHVWPRLNAAWAVFFAGMALLNAWVAEAFSTDVWVDFKLFGTLGLTVVFMVGQVLVLASRDHLRDTAKDTTKDTSRDPK